MKNKEISPEESIAFVRVAIKCADALVDFDVIEDLVKDKKAKYMKHNLKKYFHQSGYTIELFSSKFLENFVKTDENVQMQLQQMFREFSLKIKFLNEEMTALVLYYAKLQSIINDVEELNYSDPYTKYLVDTCREFIDSLKIKYKTVLQKTDEEGHGVQDIINGLNKLGKTIMY